MITRREAALKWAVTSVCALALLFVHALITSRISLLGVAPFLPPVIVACICSIENDLSSVIFSLIFGVLCDLSLAPAFPCLYTLAFPLAAAAILVLAHSLLQPGFFCALAATIVTFLIADTLSSAALLIAGSATVTACAALFVRELLASFLLLLPCYAVFAALHQFFTI